MYRQLHYSASVLSYLCCLMDVVPSKVDGCGSNGMFVDRDDRESSHRNGCLAQSLKASQGHCTTIGPVCNFLLTILVITRIAVQDLMRCWSENALYSTCI